MIMMVVITLMMLVLAAVMPDFPVIIQEKFFEQCHQTILKDLLTLLRVVLKLNICCSKNKFIFPLIFDKSYCQRKLLGISIFCLIWSVYGRLWESFIYIFHIYICSFLPFTTDFLSNEQL